MKAIGHLHALIHALTKEEKRYVRLHFQQGAGKPHRTTAILFDLLEAMSVFEKSAWEQQLEKSSFSGHLPSAQTRLQDAILLCLNRMRGGHTMENRFRALLSEIEILHEKKQVALCRKRLSQAKKIAEKYDLGAPVLELIDLEYEVNLADAPGPDANQKPDYDPFAPILSRLNRRYQLLAIQQKLRRMIREYAYLPEAPVWQEFREALSKPILQQAPPETEIISKLYYHNIHALYQLNTGAFDNAVSSYTHLMKLWDENPLLIPEHPAQYLGHYHNYLIALFNSTDPGPFRIKALELRTQAPLPERFALKKTWISYSHELNYYLHFSPEPAGKSFLAGLEGWLKEEAEALSLSRRIAFWYNLSVYYFFHASFSKANQSLQQILQLPKSSERKDIRMFAPLLQILIQIEKEDDELALYLIQAHERQIRHDPLVPEFQTLLMKELKAMCNTTRGSEGYQAGLAAVLEKLRPDGAHPEFREATGVKLIRIWATARSSGSGLLEGLRNARYY